MKLPKAKSFSLFTLLICVLVLGIVSDSSAQSLHTANESHSQQEALLVRYSGFQAFTTIFDKVVLSAKLKGEDKKQAYDALYEKFFYEDRKSIFRKILNEQMSEINLNTLLVEKSNEYVSFCNQVIVNGRNWSKHIKKSRQVGYKVPLLINSVPVNLGFETGSFSGWNGNYGLYNCTIPTPNVSNVNGFDTVYRQHEIVSGGIDSLCGFSLVSPFYGSKVCRLGDFGPGCAVAEVSQTFQVSPADTSFAYAFALVFTHGHLAKDDATFSVVMTDQLGDTISFYKTDAYKADSLKNLGLNNWLSVSGYYLYHKWMIMQVPLGAYVGQNVNIKFISSDCNQGAHMGYAYVDCTSDPSNIGIQLSSGNCGNSILNLTAPSGFDFYSWTTTGGNIISGTNSQTAVIDQPGTYEVSMSNIWGGTVVLVDTVITVVPVSTAPPPSAYYIMSTDTACTGSSISFTDLSGGNPYLWQWNFGDGFISGVASPTHSYTVAGTYTVSLIVDNGCSDTVSGSLVILPKAGTSIITNGVFCKNTPIAFSTPSPSFPTTWSWNFGDGTPLSGIQNPVHTYTVVNSYTVTLTATGMCSGSSSLVIGAHPLPYSIFSATSDCEGQPNIFSNSSTAGSYVWDFGDLSTSSASNPTHTYSSAGTYPVELLVISSYGCRDSVTHQVNVYGIPSPSFTYQIPCNSLTGTFVSTTTCISPIGTCMWHFGGSNYSFAAAPIYSFPGPGLYTVTLTASTSTTPSCAATYSATALVFAGANPIAIINHPADQCVTGNSFYFSNGLSQDPATNYSWNFGDGGSGVGNPKYYSYNSPGTYIVTEVVAQGNCTDTILDTVIVFPNPIAPIIFQNGNTLSSNATSGNQWYMNGHPMAGQTDSVLLITQNGSYSVQFTDTNGCKAMSAPMSANFTEVKEDVDSIEFAVFPNPNAGIFDIVMRNSEKQRFTFEIKNALGQIIVSEICNPAEGAFKKSVDISSFPKGFYFLTLFSSGQQFTRKIIYR
jgi:PKD repeat protein